MKKQNKLQQSIKHIKTMFYTFIGCKFNKKRYNLIPMRELSETEKQVIVRLVKWEEILKNQPDNYFQLNLEILFGDLCKKYNSFFNIDFNNGIVVLKSTNELKGTGLAENNSFRRDFISLTHFIDYLKTEKLIYLVPIDPDVNQVSYERNCLIPQKTPFKSEIIDNEFVLMLMNSYKKDIYPTEYLTKYYANDCKTDEEIRFKDTMAIANEGIKKARTAIYVAICVGVASILLTLITLLRPSNDTELILNRIDKLEERTDKRFNELEYRLTRKIEIGDSLLNDKFDKKINNIEERLDKLEQKPAPNPQYK